MGPPAHGAAQNLVPFTENIFDFGVQIRKRIEIYGEELLQAFPAADILAGGPVIDVVLGKDFVYLFKLSLVKDFLPEPQDGILVFFICHG
jgi:hypothetical protein